MADDEHLAYGESAGRHDNDESQQKDQDGERGLFGDAFGRLKKDGGLSSFFNKVHGVVHDLGSEVTGRISDQEQDGSGVQDQSAGKSGPYNRYMSFANVRQSNDVKWYVDGCSYMWAVSVALERAQESVWILDWWLSPELYLRRPPASNQQYRLDRMLQAAAQRGVKINIIVYKEVTQALTRKYLAPTLPQWLRTLIPRGTNPILSQLTGLGVTAFFASLERLEIENPLIGPPITVDSSHTKHALEDLHPNIAVFRHPDHLPDAQTLQSSFISSLQNLSLDAATATKLPGTAIKALYGMNDDVILYWAHHEKLCIIDGQTSFMGGLDLCYGRWDTNQHSIADAHPNDLNEIVFPGQDFNNARIMDFTDVPNWQNNTLDRKSSSRMGWSDVSISLHGPVVGDLKQHFVDRWNFIYDEKYEVRKDIRYSRLRLEGSHQEGAYPYEAHGQQRNASSGLEKATAPTDAYENVERRHDGNRSAEEHEHGTLHQHMRQWGHLGEEFKERVEEQLHQSHGRASLSDSNVPIQGSMSCQIIRSAGKWSHGIDTEHSIADAYVDAIQNSEHFVYIENQFFITATGDLQKPVKNKIGAAIVDRILRAAGAGQRYQIIVVMPSVPAFAGDLKDDSSLGTRAIMEFQYQSINRGGHSIMEEIANRGVNPLEYIRFYNLRSYDRINASSSMQEAEQASGVDYEAARRQHERFMDPVGHSNSEGADYQVQTASEEDYRRYQQTAEQIPSGVGTNSSRWDSVAECYMLGGCDIREVPWENGDLSEIEAFVSEELYVHSKILIADDRRVICGSANLNDRSQLGYHDSEIAIIVDDSEQVASSMNGQPWQATRFASSLRRFIFRKHLGLVPAQNIKRADQNYEPVGLPNTYDFGSREDQIVTDPLTDSFLDFWNRRAKQNTDAFGRIFHPVPHDDVQTWQDYDNFYTRFFHDMELQTEGKNCQKSPAKYKWGHVVEENFSPGRQGVAEMKDLLSTIKGTLVEMPLLFLIKEDIAKEGLSLNALTEEVYT